MEGRLEVTLPGTLLEAKPVDRHSPIVLRIADTRPHGNLIYYDLRYVGLVPGEYDLRTNLVRKDGSSTADLPPLRVTAVGLLPKDHKGELVDQVVKPWSIFGSYRQVMIGVGVLWALLFVPLYFIGRRKKAEPAAPPPPPAPTLADRLRPLVEQAAAGTLTRDGQAQLERMLLNHWRERLGLTTDTFAEAIHKLREHAEAGALLRELENWLHRPPGSVSVDVERVLAPYRDLAPAESASTTR